MQTIIPLAAASELILTWFYDHLVRRAGDPPAVTFLVGLVASFVAYVVLYVT